MRYSNSITVQQGDVALICNKITKTVKAYQSSGCEYRQLIHLQDYAGGFVTKCTTYSSRSGLTYTEELRYTSEYTITVANYSQSVKVGEAFLTAAYIDGIHKLLIWTASKLHEIELCFLDGDHYNQSRTLYRLLMNESAEDLHYYTVPVKDVTVFDTNGDAHYIELPRNKQLWRFTPYVHYMEWNKYKNLLVGENEVTTDGDTTISKSYLHLSDKGKFGIEVVDVDTPECHNNTTYYAVVQNLRVRKYGNLEDAINSFPGRTAKALDNGMTLYSKQRGSVLQFSIIGTDSDYVLKYLGDADGHMIEYEIDESHIGIQLLFFDLAQEVVVALAEANIPLDKKLTFDDLTVMAYHAINFKFQIAYANKVEDLQRTVARKELLRQFNWKVEVRNTIYREGAYMHIDELPLDKLQVMYSIEYAERVEGHTFATPVADFAILGQMLEEFGHKSILKRMKDASNTVVTLQDSYAVGNCEYGTKRFVEQFQLIIPTTVGQLLQHSRIHDMLKNTAFMQVLKKVLSSNTEQAAANITISIDYLQMIQLGKEGFYIETAEGKAAREAAEAIERNLVSNQKYEIYGEQNRRKRPMR